MGTGANPTYPAGWAGYKSSGTGPLAANAFITTATAPAFLTSIGDSGTGTVFNFGLAGNADRALGSVASGTTIPAVGALFVNNSGSAINLATLQFSFRGEQWRTGNNAATDTLTFQYLTGPAIDVTFAGGNTAATLDINESNTADTNVAIDGNAVGNFQTVTGLSPLTGTWNNGDRLAIRWVDLNTAGNDAGLAIDNLVIVGFTPVPEPATLLGVTALGAFALRGLRRRFTSK